MEDELLVPTKIIHSKRKTLALCINLAGDLIVRAPLRCSEVRINAFINSKASWIISKRREFLNKKTTALNLREGQTFSILGETFNIFLCESGRAKIIGNNLYLSKINPKESLKALLKKMARTYLKEQTQILSQKFGFNYTSISITSSKTRWASCGYKNSLNFCFRLMLCPKPVVEYVIIHELCHTKEKNHQSRFWKLVERCCKDYKTHIKWLKDNRVIMELI